MTNVTTGKYTDSKIVDTNNDRNDNSLNINNNDLDSRTVKED